MNLRMPFLSFLCVQTTGWDSVESRAPGGGDSVIPWLPEGRPGVRSVPPPASAQGGGGDLIGDCGATATPHRIVPHAAG